MRKLALAFLLAASVPPSFAATEVVDGIEWTYTVSNGEASVGDAGVGYIFPAVPETTTGRVAIPTTLGGNPVTSIGSLAFSGCSGLTSISIPDSVTSIGDRAFSGCSGLTSVTIPGGMKEIGWYAFDGCSGLTSITIPDSVTSIEDGAFRGCSELKSLRIPGSVTNIGAGFTAWCSVCSDCSNLVSIVVDSSNPFFDSRNGCNAVIRTSDNVLLVGCGKTAIPDGVESIGNFAFSGCSGLSSVTIPDGVTSIGRFAFSGCSGLTSVTIPSSVTNIGESAFAYSDLTSITIPSGVTNIGRSAFHSCLGLTSITIPDSVTSIGEYTFAYSGLTTITILGGVTSVGYTAFYGCSDLTSVTIPDGVTSIGEYAFAYSGLTSITIPGSVTNLGMYAFENCPSLTSVTISDGVPCIGTRAFARCSGLTSISIPSSVTNIGYFAFYGCSGLTSVTIPGSVTSISNNAFDDCSGLTLVMISNGVQCIGWCAFAGCTNLTSLTIPDSVTSIGGKAFQDCPDELFDTTSIPGVRLVDGWVVGYTGSVPENLDLSGIRGIADCSFGDCDQLTSVTIPEGVPGIGSKAFYGCSMLTSISIPSSVTSIGEHAFSYCSGLTSVTIPDSVTNIGEYAFAYSGLTSITIPGGVTSIGWCAFESCGGLTSVTISEGVTSIESYAFLRCSGLTSVTIPSSVTSIGESAFASSGLTSITIPDGVTDIGTGAFSGCSGLTSVVIPDSVTSFGWDNSAFWRCYAVSTVTADPRWGTLFTTATNFSFTIPESVTNIGDSAFHGCSGLTSVTIPDSVTNIGSGAFSGCSGLSSIMIPDSVTSIGEYAFASSGLTSITIPDGVTSIGQYAFLGCSRLGTAVISGTAQFSCNSLSGSITNAVVSCNSKMLTATPFRDCANLKTITVPSGVTNIVQNAFAGCSGLEMAYLPFSCIGKTDSLGLPSGCEIVFGTAIEGDSGIEDGAKPLSFRCDENKRWVEWWDESVPDGACLRSGTIATNDESALLVHVSGSGRLSFDWKVSAGRGDSCAFVVDGVETNVIRWSMSWRSVSIELGDGKHILQWIFKRGTGSAAGEDAAFVDNVDWRPDVSLQVASAFGTPDPATGAYALVYGDSVAATVAEPAPENGVRRVFMGWTGTGSVPASGTASAVSFVVTNDSSLTWNWRTEYPLAVATSGPATADFSEGWVESGTTKVVHWTPTVPYFDVAISGDTSGVVLDRDARTLSIPANRARSVALSVTERVIVFAATGPVTTDFAEVWGEDADKLVVHWTPTVPYFKVSLSGDTGGVALDENARTLTVPTSRSRTFSLVVEELTLERALDTTGLVWTTDAARPWFPQIRTSSDGEDAAQSGSATGDDVSWLETVLQGAGTLSWTWRVSTADNVGVYVLLDGEWLDAYAPGMDWAEESLAVAGDGRHVVRFEFWNAGSTPDAKAWLDQVSWTGDVPFGARLSLVSVARAEAAFSVVSFLGNEAGTMHRTLELATDGQFGTVVKTVVLADTTTNAVEQVSVSGLSTETAYWARVRISLGSGEESVSETVPFATAAHVAPALGTPSTDARAIGATISIPLAALGSDGGPAVVSVAVTVVGTGATAGTAVPAMLDTPGTTRIEVSGLAPQTAYRFVITARSVETGRSSSVSGGFTTDWGETPRIAAGGSGLGNLPALCFLPSESGDGEDFVIRIDNPVPGCWYPVYTNGTPAGQFAVQSCAMPENTESGYVIRVPVDADAKFVKIGVSRIQLPTGTVEGWTPVFTVSFDSAGGSPVASITAPYGSALVAPAPPTMEGHVFAGWVPAFPATMPEGGATLTAQWISADETNFDWTISGNSVTITGVKQSPTGSVAIPAEIGGLPVTRIGNQAFRNRSGMTSIRIPAGVTSIGTEAFEGCSGLTEVHVADLATWCEIDFGVCANPLECAHHLFVNGSEVTDLVVPDNAMKVGRAAFRLCYGLTSATIPDHVTDIGGWAFSSCTNLVSVTVGNGVTNIEENVFGDCSRLSTLVLPSRFEGKTGSMGIPTGCVVTFRD